MVVIRLFVLVRSAGLFDLRIAYHKFDIYVNTQYCTSVNYGMTIDDIACELVSMLTVVAFLVFVGSK